MRFVVAITCSIVLASIVNHGGLRAATPCGALAGLALPGTTITLASEVGTGPFSPAASGGTASPITVTQAFCRVAATLRPSGDSEIRMELWMPVTGWNGK